MEMTSMKPKSEQGISTPSKKKRIEWKTFIQLNLLKLINKIKLNKLKYIHKIKEEKNSIMQKQQEQKIKEGMMWREGKEDEI